MKIKYAIRDSAEGGPTVAYHRNGYLWVMWLGGCIDLGFLRQLKDGSATFWDMWQFPRYSVAPSLRVLLTVGYRDYQVLEENYD